MSQVDPNQVLLASQNPALSYASAQPGGLRIDKQVIINDNILTTTPQEAEYENLSSGVFGSQQSPSSQVQNPNDVNINSGSIAVENAGQEGSDIAYNQLNQNVNPDLNGAPVYTANGFDKNSDSNNNPNERLSKESKNSENKKDPKSEINQGGNKSHTITKKEISDLEKQTNLTLYPYIMGGELARIKHQFANLNQNKYYLLLNMLVYGFDNKILQSGIYGQDKYVIDKAFLNDFIKMANQPGLQEAIKKTPAWQKGCFKDIGKFGSTQANANNMNANPITGPKSEHPTYATQLLNAIHPEAVGNLDSYCDTVRTQAYLSLPKTAYAAIQSLVGAINGIIQSFQKMILDIYNGIMYYIQILFQIINGFIAKVIQLIMSFLESIIPLDLLCLLLLILKKNASQLPILSSLMSLENVMNKFESQIMSQVQKALNPLADFANKISLNSISPNLTKELNQVINFVGMAANMPDSYLSNSLSNFGYGMAAQQTHQSIVDELKATFGETFAQFNAVFGSIIGQQPNKANPQSMPKSPDFVSPSLIKQLKEDIYGHPVDKSKIFSNIPGGG